MGRTRSFCGANQVPWEANYNEANSLRGETLDHTKTKKVPIEKRARICFSLSIRPSIFPLFPRNAWYSGYICLCVCVVGGGAKAFSLDHVGAWFCAVLCHVMSYNSPQGTSLPSPLKGVEICLFYLLIFFIFAHADFFLLFSFNADPSLRLILIDSLVISTFRVP